MSKSTQKEGIKYPTLDSEYGIFPTTALSLLGMTLPKYSTDSSTEIYICSRRLTSIAGELAPDSEITGSKAVVVSAYFQY